MEILQSTHVRNGVTAKPFDMGIVRDKGSDFLVIQFDIDHTAAIEVTGISMKSLENHLRGDYFSDTFKSLLEKEKKKNGL